MSDSNKKSPYIKKQKKQPFTLRTALLIISTFIVAAVFNSIEMSKVVSTLTNSPWDFLSVVAAIITLALGYLYGSRAEDVNLNEAESSTHVDSSKIMGAQFSVSQNQISEDGLRPLQEISVDLSTKPHLHTPFEIYANAVVEAIDNRIGLSEIKANGLLVKGQRMMGIGVGVYLFFIVFWQVLSHAWGYNNMILVGFISSSMLFIVLEFLAAWYLKQYRSYVDLSAAYLQIRCIYNNYLLTYYALNQFSSESDIRNSLAEMLAQKMDWPSINDMNKNDFNYMLSSIESFSGVLEKLKLQLNPTKKTTESKTE